MPTTIEQLGFSRHHRRETVDVNFQLPETNQIFPDLGFTDDKIETMSVDKLIAGTIRSQQITLGITDTRGDVYIAGGTFNAAAWTATNGFILGLDDSASNREKFYLGNAVNWMDWNVTAADTLTVAGTLTASQIHIPDTTTANSFHVNTSGTMWIGANVDDFTADNNNATAYILNTGVARLASVTVTSASSTITGGALVAGYSANSDNFSFSNVGLSSQGALSTSIRIWAGDTFANRATAAFRVTDGGAITATSGTIGGWNLSATVLRTGATDAASNVLIDSANSLIRLGPTTGNYITIDGANQRLRSFPYDTGVRGFTIEPNLIEAENIIARGIMRGSTFMYDVISAVGGQVMIANSDILASDMTALDASTLTTRGTTTTWAVNDIVVIRQVTALGIQEEWLRITGIGAAPTYTVTRDLAGVFGVDANPIWQAGTTVVRQGSSDGAAAFSGGWLRLFGEGTNSPYYSVYRRTGVAYNTFAEVLRMGNLNGYLDYASNIFGFAVGSSAAGEANITIDPTNGIRMRQGTTNLITMDNAGTATLLNLTVGGSLNVFTSGNLRSGQTAYNTDTGWFWEYNGGTPRMSIGNPAGNYLTYNGADINFNGTLTVGSLPNMPPDENLVGYWAFDERGGSTALDSTLNANNGTLEFGTEVYVTGVSGTGIDFNGVSGRIVVASNAAMDNIFDASGVVSVWINPDSDGGANVGRIFEFGSNAIRALVQDEAGGFVRLRFYVRFSGTDGIWDTGVVIPINSWTHIVFNYNADAVGNDPTIYLNGVSTAVTETQTPVGTRVSTAGSSFKFGNDNSGTSTFDGTIDEIRMYSSSLTALQARALYLNPTGNQTTRIGPNGIVTGNLSAISADLGTITAGSISVVSGGNTIGFTPLGANAIFSGPTGAPTFAVTPAGVLTATGANISGTITATAGAIGGFNIGADYIRDVANSFGLASTVTGGDDVRFWAGDTFANRATAPFRVTEAGVLTATAGTIGGFTITSTTLTGGILQTASSGQRVVINSTGLQAYNANDVKVFDLVSDGSNLISIIKPDSLSNIADIIRIVDNSGTINADLNATMTVNSGGTGATKDGLLWQRTSGTTIRYLSHWEMVTPGAGTNVVTNIMRFTQPATCNVTDGIIYSMTGGTASTSLLNLDVSGGTLSNYIMRIVNSTAAGQGGVISNSSASNASTCLQLIHANAAANPLEVDQNGATSTNFYRVGKFGKTGTVVITMWVGNNATPNGTLTGSTGDVCFNTDGNVYRCTGTTNWTAM